MTENKDIKDLYEKIAKEDYDLNKPNFIIPTSNNPDFTEFESPEFKAMVEYFKTPITEVTPEQIPEVTPKQIAETIIAIKEETGHEIKPDYSDKVNENMTPEEIKEQLIKNDDRHSPNNSLLSPESQLKEAPTFDSNGSASSSEQQI